jgi:beta-1,4-mannooligosaccharide/beta-1,4-mannosyl-N-acetylglucosamine phosphorylase
MFKEAEVISRSAFNPVMSAEKVPYNATLTFNAAVCKFQGKYIMLFRNDYNFTAKDFQNGGGVPLKTNIGLAFSDDGINWDVQKKPCFPMALSEQIIRVYDPRITVIEERCHLCFAVDTPYGVRGGIAVTDDFYHYEIQNISVPDNRNMVLFPEKINGNYVRLERPFPVYGRFQKEAFDIWISQSPDLHYWGDHQLLLGAENVPYANCKIGPAAPPIKTSKGWLTTFHAVWKYDDKKLSGWENQWNKEYFAGLLLLDLENPAKIIGMSKEPLLVSKEEYELDGFRGSVIFPGGMILEDSGEVKIYYGAADTVECLATASVDDLLKLCL